ncbi:MAG: NAD(P)/FAD-dependent oxidoreductase [Chloroflexota bacterium]|nr:NAD(P)/FAD-dependent oxidoreductase [Chloroflexota bacterium]
MKTLEDRPKIQGENTKFSSNGAAKTTPYTQPAPNRRARRPRVLVVGAGFGGLNAARTLEDTGVDVMVLDCNNYHGFWPLLYQVATAGIESEAIAYPVRGVFRGHNNIRFRMSTVTGVDLARKVVLTENLPIAYDYLILAAGSANNYFGNNELAKHTFGLKDIDEAEHLRNRLLYSYEQAAIEVDPKRRQELMTFVIVGGGPTGVELSGAISELIHLVFRKDYPGLDLSRSRVILVEATDKVLASFPESLQQAARRDLKERRVELRLNSKVQSVENGVVTFEDGSTIKAAAVVWAAGVRGSHLGDTLGVETGKGGRVKVTPQLHVPGHPEVFVVGDMSYLEGYKGGQAYPMVAQVAIQQGKHAARNILAQVARQPMRPFRYFDYGSMATIGRRSAVFDAFGVRLSGRVAWFGWLFVHILYLIGFRNRVIVLTNWAYNYFAAERAVRLITGKDLEMQPIGE